MHVLKHDWGATHGLCVLAQAEQVMCGEKLDQLPALEQEESLLRNYIQIRTVFSALKEQPVGKKKLPVV